jgi:quercetin dioxygenase-like cupin family protein
MNRTYVAIAIGFGAICLALLANGRSTAGGGGFTELYRVELSDASELEVVMGVIKRTGESDGGKHYHPGGEFGFVLEGTVIVRTENEPPLTLRAGASFHQPAGEWHAVSTVAYGARTVVFRVLKKGQPMIVVVE